MEKRLSVHVQCMLKISRFYTLAEILSKILFVKKRRKIGDLIYDHGLTCQRFGANLILLKYIMLSLFARLTPLHSENVD